MAKIHIQTMVTGVEVVGDVGKTTSVLFTRDREFPEGVVVSIVAQDGKVIDKMVIEESAFRLFKTNLDKL